MYLWQQPRWPEFNWDARTQAGALADAHKEQGRLLGRMEALGFESRNDTCRLGMDIDGLTTRGLQVVSIPPLVELPRLLAAAENMAAESASDEGLRLLLFDFPASRHCDSQSLGSRCSGQ
jgi:hypothetical protein